MKIGIVCFEERVDLLIIQPARLSVSVYSRLVVFCRRGCEHFPDFDNLLHLFSDHWCLLQEAR